MNKDDALRHLYDVLDKDSNAHGGLTPFDKEDQIHHVEIQRRQIGKKILGLVDLYRPL